MKLMHLVLLAVLFFGCAKEAVKEKDTSLPKKEPAKTETTISETSKTPPSSGLKYEKNENQDITTKEDQAVSSDDESEAASDISTELETTASQEPTEAVTLSSTSTAESEIIKTSLPERERTTLPLRAQPSVTGDSVDVLYMTKPGDYLSRIALNEYGRVSVWRRIWRWNYAIIGDNPNLIYPYHELTLKKPVEIANPVKYDFYDYVVQEGETLWDIAKKEYGSNYAWIVIVRDNFNTIGSNYDSLKEGMVLKIRTRLY